LLFKKQGIIVSLGFVTRRSFQSNFTGVKTGNREASNYSKIPNELANKPGSNAQFEVLLILSLQKYYLTLMDLPKQSLAVAGEIESSSEFYP